ncbi:hypothetical protein ABEX25_17505 [Paenibacillus thiaminolyticus]|uniref:hypothetical protein n=1 Tax=Paenibacillus thiaminolyticus TaxID=49283 RepID=UPI003D288770
MMDNGKSAFFHMGGIDLLLFSIALFLCHPLGEGNVEAQSEPVPAKTQSAAGALSNQGLLFLFSMISRLHPANISQPAYLCSPLGARIAERLDRRARHGLSPLVRAIRTEL